MPLAANQSFSAVRKPVGRTLVRPTGDGWERPPERAIGPVVLRVIRGFKVSINGNLVALPSNVQRVIAFLAVRDCPQHRTTIAAALWMDTPGDRAAANLRTALWKGRQFAGPCLVDEGGYVAVAPAVEIDLRRVMSQVQRLFVDGAVLLDEDTDPAGLAGDLLPDWDEEWLTYERERLRQLRIHALEALCSKLSAAGRPGEAIAAGLAAVAAEPLRDSAQRALIAAHLDNGNVCEARRQYRVYRRLLWDELRLEPSPSLRSLVGPGGR